MMARIVAAVAICSAVVSSALAQTYPSKPINIVIGYTPGAVSDLTARTIADGLSRAWGQPVIVDNKPGSGGNIGAAFVARAAPDGYTLMIGTDAQMASNVHLYKSAGFDPVKDFAPVAYAGANIICVAVNAELPIKTVADVIAYAKANPGKLNYGSSGAGGLTHYAVELFEARTGTHMVHIPFKGGAPATAAVMSGDIDLSFANMTDALPQIEAGTVRGLAVTSRERSPYLPNLPSIHEAVAPDFLVETWNGVMAPAKTPDAIINKLSGVLLRMADDAEIKEQMRKAGSSTVKSTPAQFRAQIAQEMAQWKPMVAEILAKEQAKEKGQAKR